MFIKTYTESQKQTDAEIAFEKAMSTYKRNKNTREIHETCLIEHNTKTGFHFVIIADGDKQTGFFSAVSFKDGKRSVLAKSSDFKMCLAQLRQDIGLTK